MAEKLDVAAVIERRHNHVNSTGPRLRRHYSQFSASLFGQFVPRATVLASSPSAAGVELHVTDDGREFVVSLLGRRPPGLTVVPHFDALLKAAAMAR